MPGSGSLESPAEKEERRVLWAMSGHASDSEHSCVSLQICRMMPIQSRAVGLSVGSSGVGIDGFAAYGPGQLRECWLWGPKTKEVTDRIAEKIEHVLAERV